MPTALDQLVTPARLDEEFPDIGKRTLRHWMFSDPDNFRGRCVVKVGKKVYIDRAALERWLEEHRAEASKED